MKNFAGLIQALTVGLPAYSATPTWMFLRNALVSDLIFTSAFVLCVILAQSRERARAASPSHALRNSGMSQPEQRDEVEMLSLMLLIRRFEERASQQYQAQKIGGFCHLYIGQEAVIIGAIAATRDDDYLITAYRDHAHALARGTSADACMAELFGKATGCSRGLGGSMHYFDKARHMYGGHAIVGAHMPLAAGMAFASKYRNEDRVTLCFFGDGAINQGAFHEAFNMAALDETAGHLHLRKQSLRDGHVAWNARLRSSRSSIAPRATTFPATSPMA